MNENIKIFINHKDWQENIIINTNEKNPIS